MAQSIAAKSSKESSLGYSRERSPLQHAFSGLSASEAEILALQQSMGNRAVSQLLEAGGDAAPVKDGIPPIVQSVLNSGSGRPLKPEVRAEMESRFQQDFSQVRIHTDSKAAESARAVNATAYTVKHDIAFDTGEYIPETKDGKQLLAHELAHVVQQSRGGGAPSPSPKSPLEQSADQAASAIAQGGESVQVSGSSAPGLARQAKKKSPWETFTHYVETAREVKDAAKATFSDDKNKDKGYVERAFLAADAGRNVVEEKLSPEEKKPLEPALKVANFVLGPPLASYKSAGGSDSPAAVQKPPPKETSTTKAPAASSTNKNEPLLLTSSLDLQNLSESDFFAEVERIKQWRINHKDESSFPRTHIEETVWSALMAEVFRRSHSKDLPPLRGFVDLRPYSKPPEDEQLIQEIDEATRAQPPLSAPTIQPSRIAVRLLVGGTLPPPGADSESQTTASDELIGKYSVPDSLTGNIYTDKLGADLSDLAVQGGNQNYKTVQDTFDKLDSTDKDDVALAMSSQMSDDQLELMIQNPNGRKFLHRLFDELTSGHLGEDEMAQANRILAVEQDTNLATQTTEGQQRAAKDALVLPYRPPGFTVTPSPIYAERLENGKICVRLRADLYGTDYRKDIFEHKIPGSVYSLEGVELDANQLVGVKLYDQGGKVVYVPALSLLTFNNQDTTKAYQMMAEAGFTGLTLGFGGVGGAVGEGAEVVEGATQASRGLQIAKNTVRGLDIAATYGTPALTAAQEHRGEVINALGEYSGKLVMGAVDTAQTGLFYYGLGRTAFGVGKRALGKSRSSTPPRSSEPKSSNLDRPKQFPKVSDEILEGQPANDFTPEAANDNAIHPDEPASMARTGTDDLGVSPNRPNLTYIQGGGAKGDQVVASAKGGGGKNVGSTNPPVRSVPPPIRNVTLSNIVSRRARPPARLSEFNTQQHLEKTLPTGQWEEQVIFKDGARAKTRSGKNPKGSTVPDHYNAQLKLAVEDKNWDIAWSYNDLRENILEQQGGRFENLPPGTKQWLYLDIRAQKITQVAELAKSLRRDLGGKKIFEEIRLITDKGIQIF